jgi:hypothetical protein
MGYNYDKEFLGEPFNIDNLITGARELCERAMPGPWEVKLHNEDYGQGYGETTFFVDTDGTLLKIGIADAAEKYAKYNALSAFIARSRSLIPELCDALEKLEKENEMLEGADIALEAMSDALEKAENRIKLLEGAIERQNNAITYLNSANGQRFNW